MSGKVSGTAAFAVALIVAGAIPATASAQLPGATAAVLVFDGVTVVDVERGKLLPAQRVVIAGNHIQAVGKASAVKLPPGAQLVDARGKYLIPGLWDLHVHTWADYYQLLLLANGVTGVRDAWASIPLDTMRRWRREILAGTRAGPPRQLLSGVAIDSRKSCVRQENGWTGHICVSESDSADVRQLVESLKAAGVDMVKTYALTKETYGMVAAEARRVGLPLGGHLHGPRLTQTLTPIEASDSGAVIIDHNDESSGGVGEVCLNYRRRSSLDECQQIAERFRRNNTWSVPTILNELGPEAKSIVQRVDEFVSRFWQADTVLRFSLGPGSKRALDDSLATMYVARRTGLPILAGTDAHVGTSYKFSTPGFSIHNVLAVYVAEGLTPLEALQTATLNPAKFLHATDSLGTIAPGKLADLVLLDADPLADITNTTTIRAVVANGRYFDRAALDGVLAEVRAKAKQNP